MDEQGNKDPSYFEKIGILLDLARAKNFVCFYLRCKEWNINDTGDLRDAKLGLYESQFCAGKNLVGDALQRQEEEQAKNKSRELKRLSKLEKLEEPRKGYEVRTSENSYKKEAEKPVEPARKECYGTERKKAIETLAKTALITLRVPPVQDSREHISNREYTSRLSRLREMPEAKALGIEIEGYSNLKNGELYNYFYRVIGEIRKLCKDEDPEFFKEITDKVRQLGY